MIGYTKGCQLIEADSLDCWARSNDKATLFYIRLDRKTNSLFNPDDAMNEVSTRQNIKGTGIERCPFISVNKNIFDLYLNFLKEGSGKGNYANLTQANRLLRGV